MRIKRLDLLAFGPFTQKTLDLSCGKPGLHIILGPNEAGKSSTLRALKAWLFGIPARSNDNFIHDHKQLRVGGVIEAADGTEIACIRRKGNKDTLLDAITEQPISDGTISRVLGGLDEKLFSRLHGIDHAALVQGGQDILDQSGDLGRSLFGAALGGRGKTDLLSELTAEAEKFFKPRGQNQLINAAVTKLKETRREEKNATVSVRDWKDLKNSLSQILTLLEKIDVDIAETRCLQSKLERFKRIAAPLAERRELIIKQDELGDVLLLSSDFAAQRQTALDRHLIASDSLQRLNAKLERLQQESRGIIFSSALLSNQTEVSELQLQIGALQKSIRDRPAQESQRRSHRNAGQELLRGIRPDLNLESVDILRPLLNKKKLLLQLAQESGLLNQKIGQFATKLRELTDEKENLQQELGGRTCLGQDVTLLRIAIAAARKSGDLAERLNKARDSELRQQQSCDRELTRLGRFDGSLDDLVGLALPEKTVLDGFEASYDQLEQQLSENHRRQVAAQQELTQAEASLKTLLRAAEVPSLNDLQTARRLRDQGWKLIRDQFMQELNANKADSNYQLREAPREYEQAVLVADDVADRLRLDAQRVQERVSLEGSIQSLQQLLSLQKDNSSELLVSRDQLLKDWRSVWQMITEKVGLPKEMKEWLLRVDQLLLKVEQLNDLRSEVCRLEASQTFHISALTAELLRLDQSCKFRAVELEVLLSFCEKFAMEQELTTRRHGELQTSILKLEQQIKTSSDALRQARADLQQWAAAWSDAVAGLGIGDSPPPELALSTMDLLEALFNELKEADIAHRRIYGMEKDEERFNLVVAQLAQRLDFDPKELTPLQVSQAMLSNLAAAQLAAARQQELEIQIKELQLEMAEAIQDRDLAQQRLLALQSQAGVSNDEEIAAVIELSQQKLKIVTRLDVLLQQLHRSGEGLSLEALEQEAQDQDIDRVGDQLEQIEQKLAELADQRDSGRDQRQQLLVQIEALDGSSKAADAAERAEQLLAAIIPDAEQFLRFTIARLILEEQIERYRQDHQTPVLKRAGELFAKLTLGSFVALRDEIDDNDKPVLLGVRPDKSEVNVSGMSEGSRDQLYLALRLATIELQDAQDPLPFVVDDILVGFDDQRSKACLDVLADFAQKNQVLVFTHHSMIARAAKELGAEKGIFVHELIR